MEEILCIGCGATIQTEDKTGLGFTPQSALEKGLETGEVYCQRCFRLRHYNEITDVQLTDDDFLKLLHEVGDSDALVVNVIDIFDFNGSVIPGLPRFVSGNDVLLVGNKKDILPKSVKDSKVTHWLMERAHEEGLRPVDVVLTSAQNKHSIREVIDKIEIPLDDGSYIYDTPGIIHRHQMAHYLTAKNLKYVSPKKEIKPKTYQLNPEQTLFLGGLGRFDFIAGEKQGFTAFFDNELKLHRTKLEGASAFYDKHLGTLLTPPNSKEKEDFPKLVQHVFTIKDKTDLVISGLGWIRVTGTAKVAVWAPEGVAVVTRKAII